VCGGWGGDYEATVDSEGAKGDVRLVQVQKIEWGVRWEREKTERLLGEDIAGRVSFSLQMKYCLCHCHSSWIRRWI
jgi:hypothetical protein